jgi:AcrR family transcriptional regulator
MKATLTLPKQSGKATLKLSSEERRAAIIKAVQRVFAEKGFDGTTTRELAEAAGVSEALLFKHFPNKEALYSAMQHSCSQGKDPAIERLKALEPSTSALVTLVHFMIWRKAGARPPGNEEDAIHMRLMLRSMLGDGEFARMQLRHMQTGWIPKIEQCLKAAVAAGDAVDGAIGSHLNGWFCHHLAICLKHYLSHEEPIVDYKVSRAKLIEQAVWFTLRGMGLKEEAIQRYYNPKALALFSG